MLIVFFPLAIEYQEKVENEKLMRDSHAVSFSCAHIENKYDRSLSANFACLEYVTVSWDS